MLFRGDEHFSICLSSCLSCSAVLSPTKPAMDVFKASEDEHVGNTADTTDAIGGSSIEHPDVEPTVGGRGRGRGRAQSAGSTNNGQSRGCGRSRISSVSSASNTGGRPKKIAKVAKVCDGCGKMEKDHAMHAL